MKALTSSQGEILDQLLSLAGSSRVLELAFQNIERSKGSQATLDDLLSEIDQLRERREVTEPAR